MISSSEKGIVKDAEEREEEEKKSGRRNVFRLPVYVLVQHLPSAPCS